MVEYGTNYYIQTDFCTKLNLNPWDVSTRGLSRGNHNVMKTNWVKQHQIVHLFQINLTVKQQQMTLRMIKPVVKTYADSHVDR